MCCINCSMRSPVTDVLLSVFLRRRCQGLEWIKVTQESTVKSGLKPGQSDRRSMQLTTHLEVPLASRLTELPHTSVCEGTDGLAARHTDCLRTNVLGQFHGPLACRPSLSNALSLLPDFLPSSPPQLCVLGSFVSFRILSEGLFLWKLFRAQFFLLSTRDE